MARVTVEDCIKKVNNCFELVLLATYRARQISAGSPITVERNRDKNPVVALREIAESTIPLDALKENLIKSLQQHTFREETDEIFDTGYEDTFQAEEDTSFLDMEEDFNDKGEEEDAQISLAEVINHPEGQKDT